MAIKIKTQDGIEKKLHINREDEKINVNINQKLLGFIPHSHDLNLEIIFEGYNFILICNDVKTRIFLIFTEDLDSLDQELLSKTIKKFGLDHLKLEKIRIE